MEGLKAFFNSVKELVDSKMLESQIQNKSSHAEPKDYTSSNPKYCFTNESKAFLDHKDMKPKIAQGSTSMRLSGVNYGTSISRLSSPGDIPAQTFIQVKEEATCYKDVIDLECEVQPEPGYCEVSSVTNCDEDPETSFVKETSGMINGISAASPCSCLKNESSSSETGLRSLRSPDQFLKRHISTPNLRKSPLGAESSAVVTPETYSNLTLEAESPLNMSVNSHALKRRKFTSTPFIDLDEENSNAPSTRPADHTSFTRRIEFGFGSTEPRSQDYNISCSLCRSVLGHPENHSYPKCLLTFSSKTYLLSLLKETLGTVSAEMPTSISVVMTDCSLVNQRVCRSFEGSKGIWCEQDGCVFNTIFCPFCSIPNTCLGVQVMATDSSNVQFLSKILFFAGQVDVTEDAVSKETSLKQEESLAVPNTDVDKSIERFAYSPTEQQDSVGRWSTTKSKLRLPKRNFPTSKKA